MRGYFAIGMLAKAVEAEVAGFLAKHADLKTEDGRSRIVRHGHLPKDIRKNNRYDLPVRGLIV